MSAPALELNDLGDELLDDPRADPRTVEASLRNIARANRWFGGTAAALFGVGRVLARVPRDTPVTLLDVGTGLGDLPAAAVRWGQRHGRRIIPVGLERSHVAAALAASHGVPTAVADAGMPPFRDGAVDVVMLSQVAHHFTARSIVQLARTCDRIARIGVVIADLRRSHFAAAGFWIGAHALGFDRVTRTDGITSVRRGFTPDELHRILADAGVTARVERRPGFRIVATWTRAA